MTDHEIEQIASTVLQQQLHGFGFTNAEARSEIDFDGGSIIRVTAHYQDVQVPSDAIINSLHRIRDVLLSKGEERFVILQSDYKNDPESEESEEVED